MSNTKDPKFHYLLRWEIISSTWLTYAIGYTTNTFLNECQSQLALNGYEQCCEIYCLSRLNVIHRVYISNRT